MKTKLKPVKLSAKRAVAATPHAVVPLKERRLNFGNKWDFAPAPEDSKNYVIAPQHELFINGKFVAPTSGKYFESINPATEQTLTTIAAANAEDVDSAVKAARRAYEKVWSKMPGRERGKYLYRIARIIQEKMRELAVLESMDGGKPIKETRDVDLPIVAAHFFYHAGWADKLQYAFPGRTPRPLGVAGQIIPWNFPLLMAAWKIAPAIAAGNCTVVKPASNTPLSLLILMDIIADVVPPGVINVITGPGGEIGRALASNPRISKIAFTGETTTGRLIMQYASETIIPMTLELGGKSPNIFMADVMDADDDFFDKALEGLALFAFNKGEVCTCPSRALIQESIFDRFLERAVDRVNKIKVGNPLDPATMQGAQASGDQMEKILEYLKVGKGEGALCATGGERAHLGGDLENGYYVKPTVFVGHNKMRVFQEEIFGPVVSVTKFKTVEEAIEIANDTVYGLGAAVWSRNGNTAYRVGREVKAGRVWTNCYHLYPAHAAFGGYKQSGFGRETHKMMLGHYQQTKNLLVSYSPKAMGFF